MRWPLRRRASSGRLPSLGQDYQEAHRRYVERLTPDAELWLRTKPFSVPPRHELYDCLRIFAHAVQRLDLDVRAQVLDVGCGPGWLSEFLARCGYWVTGVDVSADMVAVARERVASIDGPIATNIAPVAEFHALPAGEIPWKGRFDAAILYDALHHLDNELETLRVIRRALVPGGRIFVHEGVRPPPGSAGERRLIEEMEEYGTLESPFDPEYLLTVLAEAGFTEITRVAAVDGLFDVSAREGELRRIRSLLERPPTNTVVAVKPVPAQRPQFAARIEPRGEPAAVEGDVVVRLRIENTGLAFWPAGLGAAMPAGTVTIGPYRVDDGGRAELPRQPLPRPLSPGDAADIDLRLEADAAGEVTVDLVREGIAWFADYGSMPLVVTLPEGATRARRR